MTVYGRQAVRQALMGPRRVGRVWATARVAGEPWLRGRDVEVVAPGAVQQRAGTESHQGICAQVSEFSYVPEGQLLGVADPLIVALDEVQDPQNLGAICRTAEAVGVTGVVLPERRSALVTAAVCRASAGAVEHLAIARVRNLADFLAAAKRAGCWCYGAAAAAPVSYDVPDYAGGAVLVLGSEGRGLRPRVAAACDELVSIPLHGRVESLNVAAAAAVLLYEVLQRRQGLDSTP